VGHDTFVFDNDFSEKTVTGFLPSENMSLLSQTQFNTFTAVQSDAQQDGTDTLIKYGSDNILTLHDVALNGLHTSDLHIV